MTTSPRLQAFGSAAILASLEEAESFIRSNAGAGPLRRQAAAFGLSLVASQAVGDSAFFEDSRHVVDEVAKAKARIDIAAWHSADVAEATALILLSAQQFLDANTIGGTEWPTPREVAEAVLEAARNAAMA